MKISRDEWEKRYTNGTLKLALIGMSNIGKSYSGMRLATHFDFNLIEVDKLIWERLGERDMDAFAEWLGQPYSKGYEDRERQSLQLESAATVEAMGATDRNPLLDTTGSVIYTGENVLKRLSDSWFIVYIEAAPEHLWELQKMYFAQPKPLAWHGHFKDQPGLSQEENLISSYPNLLESRKEAYARLADKTISSEDILTRRHTRLFDLMKPAR